MIAIIDEKIIQSKDNNIIDMESPNKQNSLSNDNILKKVNVNSNHVIINEKNEGKTKNKIEEKTNDKKERTNNNNIIDNEENNNYSHLFIPTLFTNVNEIKEYVCSLCKTVFDEPIMELCGCLRVFCKKCLYDYFSKNDNKCPISNKVISHPPQDVLLLSFAVGSFEMKCKNNLTGCNWKGKCKDYKEHLQNYCLKEKIKCPNLGCYQLMEREKINTHLQDCEYRSILCKICNDKIQFINKEKHEFLCYNNTEIDCPQRYGEKFKRNKLKEHLIDCPNALIDCPFVDFGCKEKDIKSEMENHKKNNINKHLILIGEFVLKLSENINNLFNLPMGKFPEDKIINSRTPSLNQNAFLNHKRNNYNHDLI